MVIKEGDFRDGGCGGGGAFFVPSSSQGWNEYSDVQFILELGMGSEDGKFL